VRHGDDEDAFGFVEFYRSAGFVQHTPQKETFGSERWRLRGRLVSSGSVAELGSRVTCRVCYHVLLWAHQYEKGSERCQCL